MADPESVQVYALLGSLTVLEHIHIAALDLRHLGVDEVVSVPITVRNCQIESLDASFLTFREPVVFDDCHFGSVFCFSAYFVGGARFNRCTFDGHVTFECGGPQHLTLGETDVLAVGNGIPRSRRQSQKTSPPHRAA